MNTYLLTWNPQRFQWEELPDLIREVKLSGRCEVRWSCGQTRVIVPGDRVYLMHLGREPRGIMGFGVVLSRPYPERHWDPQSQTRTAYYVDVEFRSLVDPKSDSQVMLGWKTLKSELPLPHNWTPQVSGISIPASISERLEQMLTQVQAQGPELPTIFGASFEVDTVYRRRDLHDRYGGQRQGGISTPAEHNLIFLFVSDTGEQFGYRDGVTEGGIYLYTGQGQKRDMVFERGNRAVRDHLVDGKDLHLFDYVDTGLVRYVGQMVCIGYHERFGSDVDGAERRLIVFELVPLDVFVDAEMSEMDQPSLESLLPLSELRERAITSDSYAASPRERLTLAHARSAAVRAYVLARADGVCEGCQSAAPFRTGSGRPYLEIHHIRRLSDGGPDHPRWVVALCPNCHRRAHYGEDRSQYNQGLGQLVRGIERRLD